MNISVVIPMYNSENTITDTINSVMGQTRADMICEIIVVNDGSTDHSAQVVEKLAMQSNSIPIFLINKANGGVSTARNTGMREAKGDWIAFIDSDDVWLPEKTELQAETISGHPDIDFLGGNHDDKELKIIFRRINTLYKATVQDICLKNFPSPTTAIFKKHIYKQIGGFDENQRYAEDGNYFMKICKTFNFYHLPVQMAVCGRGKRSFGQKGLSANLKKMYEGNVKNIKEIKHDKTISFEFYIFLRFFYWLKYIRRIVITRLSSGLLQNSQA